VWRRAEGRASMPKDSAVNGKDADPYSISLLQVSLRQLEKIASQRRTNYLALVELIKHVPDVQPLFEALPDGVCPFVLPIHMNRPSARQICASLQHSGIPAIQWPDLAPEVVAEPNRHAQAIAL